MCKLYGVADFNENWKNILTLYELSTCHQQWMFTYPHLWGDSPVCCRTWFNKCSFLVKVFEQKSQRWGVSPVCHIMWFVKCSFLVNALPHISQRKGVSFVCERIWFAKCSFRVYFLPQTFKKNYFRNRIKNFLSI